MASAIPPARSYPLPQPQPDSPTAQTAGKVFAQVDSFLGKLGKAIGVKTYRPFHSSGEDHLPSYLRMIGIPTDIVPEFPTDAKTVLLTEQARFDPAIVGKIKKQLVAGNIVVITSGLLKALQRKGIEDIVELEYTGQTVATREFAGRGGRGARLDEAILLPKIRYATNDSWEVVSAFTSSNRTSGTPVLLSTKYSKGLLYVLTIPQDEGDLYHYPQNVLNSIRNVIAKDMYVRLDAPSLVSLFVYDNDRFIVESFGDNPVTARVATDGRITRLHHLVTGEVLTGQPQAVMGGRGRSGRSRGHRVRSSVDARFLSCPLGELRLRDWRLGTARLFPHTADLPILQFRAMQAAGPGRDRAIAHLFHLIRGERLEVLSEAHVVVQLADGAAADGGAMDGQAQRILQALFGIQDPKQECVAEDFHGLHSNASLPGHG